MKREFLKELGVEESVIEKIMTENGKDIEAVKSKTKADEASIAQQKSEIESLKTQLSEANKAIDGFKELDVESIKKAAAEWEAKAKEAELKRQSDLDNLKFGCFCHASRVY